MKVVLDTNVVDSGLLNPFCPSGEIVRMASAGALSLCFDARVLAEYSDVLFRPKSPFEPAEVAAFLEQVRARGELVASQPLARRLPHEDDEVFLEVALAGNAEHLVTGNLKHFPPSKRAGVSILSPANFLAKYRQQMNTQ